MCSNVTLALMIISYTYLASKAKARMPATSGADALVPVKWLVHFPWRSVLTCMVHVCIHINRKCTSQSDDSVCAIELPQSLTVLHANDYHYYTGPTHKSYSSERTLHTFTSLWPCILCSQHEHYISCYTTPMRDIFPIHQCTLLSGNDTCTMDYWYYVTMSNISRTIHL